MLKTPRCYERKCKHFRGVMNPDPEDERAERVVCAAFKEIIPDDIAYGDNLHTKPVPKQGNEIVYEREAPDADAAEKIADLIARDGA